MDIAYHRLRSQRLTGGDFQQANQVVQWLGAVQAQDYTAAKWAVAQRAEGLTDAAIEQSFTEGSILRTHVMRPTWHFVAPGDIRWLLKLTAPRVHAANAYYYRRLELDRALIKRSNAALSKALRGSRHLTRAELGSVLRQAGIAAADLRLGYIILAAELDGVICSGPRRGKQFTYALLDERVLATEALARDQALAELARRYFTSHGPATEQDFSWWSGRARAEVRSSLELVKGELEQEVVDGKTYWFAPSAPPAKVASQAVYLLPNYDEYVVGYTDRGAIFDPSHAGQLDARRNPLFQHTLLIRGQIAGTWKSTLTKNTAVIELNPFVSLTQANNQALARAVRRYGNFLNLPVTLTWTGKRNAA